MSAQFLDGATVAQSLDVTRSLARLTGGIRVIARALVEREEERTADLGHGLLILADALEDITTELDLAE
jgi:hypothetical protein